MGIFLEGGFAFEFWQKRLQGIHLHGGENDSGLLHGLTVTGLDELHDGAGCACCDGRELYQPFGGFDLAILQLKPLLLEGSEELLNDPALPIPTDHAPGHGGIPDLVGRQQSPQNGLPICRRVNFADFDQTDLDRRSQVFVVPDQMSRPLKRNPRETRFQMGGAGWAAGSRAKLDRSCARQLQRRCRKLAATFLDRPIVHGAG